MHTLLCHSSGSPRQGQGKLGACTSDSSSSGRRQRGPHAYAFPDEICKMQATCGRRRYGVWLSSLVMIVTLPQPVARICGHPLSFLPHHSLIMRGYCLRRAPSCSGSTGVRPSLYILVENLLRRYKKVYDKVCSDHFTLSFLEGGPWYADPHATL